MAKTTAAELNLTDAQKQRFEDLKQSAIRNEKNGGNVVISARDLRLLVFVGLNAMGGAGDTKIDPGADLPAEEKDANVAIK